MNSKVAIVTGGSKGIGAAIVRKLALAGYDVVLNYNKSAELAQNICSEFENVISFQADVSNSDNVKTLVDYTIKNFGKIDLIVNNAGIDLYSMLSDTSDSDFDNVMRTNLYSAFYLSREASKSMVANKCGHIINISSIWGITGASCEMAYSVSKAGMDALTKSLAKELGPSNIRVNSIAPGIIDTDMNKFLKDDELKDIIDDIPLSRIGLPEDVAGAVLFLENCSYITGQIIQVNGGWNI